MARARPGTERSRTALGARGLLLLTALVVGAEVAVGGTPAVGPAVGVVVLALGSLELGRWPRLRSVSSLPVAAGLLLSVALLLPGLASLVVGLAAGLVALLWVGLPVARRAGVADREVAREFLLPLVGGVLALVAASIPLVGVLRPAALVIPVFAGLALLVIFLTELTARAPGTPGADGAPEGVPAAP